MPTANVMMITTMLKIVTVTRPMALITKVEEGAKIKTIITTTMIKILTVTLAMDMTVE